MTADVYRNPVLNADWSDPDVVRVGDDFYLTASSFGRLPGLPLLHSRDLVNRTLVGHALDRLEPAEEFPQPRHDCGVWAPSLRHHEDRFWIFWGDPDQGIGWTTNLRTQITVDHNWFTGTKQRNPSADNCAYAHLNNNYLSAQVADGDPTRTYGNWSRGRTRMVIENSYYDGVQHPYQADATAELVERGSILRNTTGRTDEWGAAFDPREFYNYRLDPAAAVPALVKRFSGPQKRIGGSVTLRVPGDYTSVQAAVDAVPAGNAGRVVIAVAPGTYREKVFIPANKPNIVLKGTGWDRSDTVIVFDTPAASGGSTGSATVRIAANDVAARHLTFGNDFDEAAHEPVERALSMRASR